MSRATSKTKRQPSVRYQPTGKSTRDRLLRAKQRDEKRQAAGKPSNYYPKLRPVARIATSGGGIQEHIETGFGPVNFSKFQYSDPGAKVTTLKENFGNQSVGHKYSEIQEALFKNQDDSKVAGELLETIEENKTTKKQKTSHTPSTAISSGQQKNAAAKFVAITHSSEPARVGGQDKAARGVLRMIKDGKITSKDALSGERPLYTMAKNPKYTRRILNEEQKKFRKPPSEPENFSELGAYMSDSSDEESS